MNNINEQSYADVLSVDRIRNDPLQIRTQVGQITQGNQSTTGVTQHFHRPLSIYVLNIKALVRVGCSFQSFDKYEMLLKSPYFQQSNQTTTF